MQKILVVDDEVDLIELLKICFEEAGYLVLTAQNGQEALEKLKQNPDLILLDIMMPGKDGYEVCEQIRATTACPIIFLTAKAEEVAIIKGLNLGADDYLTKPFQIKELKARVAAHLRREERKHLVKKSVIYEGTLRIDLSSREVTCMNCHLELTPKEFEVIRFLVENQGQTFSKEQIYEAIWGYDGEGEARTITEHVKNIRKKLVAVGENTAYITTVWGIGYRWH